jgi:hypothetical protein
MTFHSHVSIEPSMRQMLCRNLIAELDESDPVKLGEQFSVLAALLSITSAQLYKSPSLSSSQTLLRKDPV